MAEEFLTSAGEESLIQDGYILQSVNEETVQQYKLALFIGNQRITCIAIGNNKTTGLYLSVFST